MGVGDRAQFTDDVVTLQPQFFYGICGFSGMFSDGGEGLWKCGH